MESREENTPSAFEGALDKRVASGHVTGMDDPEIAQHMAHHTSFHSEAAQGSEEDNSRAEEGADVQATSVVEAAGMPALQERSATEAVSDGTEILESSVEAGADEAPAQTVQESAGNGYGSAGDRAFESATQVAAPVVAAPKSGDNFLSQFDEEADVASGSRGSGNKNSVKGDPQAKKRRWPWVLAAGVLLLAGAYGGACYAVSNKVPAGTKVAGVDISRLSEQDAQARLEKELAPRLDDAVDVSLEGGEGSVQLVPRDAGIALDALATTKPLVGFSLNPVTLWQHISGNVNVNPEFKVDEGALNTAFDAVDSAIGAEPKDAGVQVDAQAVKLSLSPGEDGTGVDRAQAKQQLTAGLLRENAFAFKVIPTKPAVTDEMAQAAMDQGNQLLSAPLKVKVGNDTATVSVQTLASAMSFEVSDGKIAMKIDGTKVGDAVRAAVPGVLKPGKDAQIQIVNHNSVQIIPSEDGIGINDEDLAKRVIEASSSHELSIDPAPVPAAFSTEDAQKLGVKEVVSELSTPITPDPMRTKNLRVGTKIITNTLVKPGETFSLLQAMGPVTPERGFVSSGVVEGGFVSNAMGGGISQISTETFNLGCLAGYVDVYHKPHSKYFKRYPMGREATLWEGQVDMKWKNNTPYGAVIDIWVEGGYVHAKLWSTKYWDVQTSTSKPYNYTQPQNLVNNSPKCVPSPAGGPGFSVNVSRTVSKDGKVNQEASGSYTWTYSPFHATTCAGESTQ